MTGQVFGGLQRLVQARRGLPQLHAARGTEVLDPPDPGVLALLRRHPEGPMLGLHNVTGRTVHVTGWLLGLHGLHGLHDCVDRVSGERVVVDDEGSVELAAYGTRWLVAG